MNNTKKQFQVALVGNPNSGKSALFNCLTGLHARVANHPGVTVDYKKGPLKLVSGNRALLIDLPGTYSLAPKSEDEEIVLHNILSQQAFANQKTDLFVYTLDATHVERNLFCLLQLKALKMPIVVALTFSDQLQSIEVKKLEEILNLKIVPVSSKTKMGLNNLLVAIEDFCENAPPPKKLISTEILDNFQTPEGIKATYAEVKSIVNQIYLKDPDLKKRHTRSDQIDNFILHPVFGPIFLTTIFSLLFTSIFTWAEPLVVLIENFNDGLADFAASVLPSNSLFSSLVVDGVIGGIGNILVFVPLIAILFTLLGLLEDSGYLARATFLLDRLLNKVGLPTKSFAPMLSSVACAVPAIMATRAIESKSDRILTILIAPLMTCSARLPVYALLIALVFSGMPPLLGFIPIGPLMLLLMYAIGAIAALIVAAIFKRTLFKGETSPLILELPPYRMPQLRPLFAHVKTRVSAFLEEAGTVILALTIIIWALFAFPQHENQTQTYQMEHSYAGQLGKFIEPVIEPLGFDWKMGIGLIASFAAREVFITSLGVVYGLGAHEDENSRSLRAAMSKDINPKTGKSTYTPLVALSLMIFFAFAMQCMSTVAITRKETRTWKWPLVQLSYMTGLAWFGAFCVYQVGLILGYQ